MELKVQKRLAGKVLKCSHYRVKLDINRLSDIKEAITKADIRSLVNEGAITEKPIKGISRGRARKKQRQKRKGRRQGAGSRKGSPGARLSRKDSWIARARSQRRFLSELKLKKLISAKTARTVYSKIKGGFFRSKRHIKLFLEENSLFNK